MSANGFLFKRGLEPDFMKELATLAELPGWFTDVLADPDLVLGIRDNYINVYWRGCSLFKIGWDGKDLKVSTHPKYLLDPDLGDPVPFRLESGNWKFQVKEITSLIDSYAGPKTLGDMKRAAKYYARGEKTGLHPVICDVENNVIDMEVTFDREGQGKKRKSTQRVDIACLEEVESSIRLRFWEAKLYRNDELWHIGDNDLRVVEQVARYRDKLQEHRDEVLESYQLVARNLVDIAKWCGDRRKVGTLVEEVAKGKRHIVLDDTAFVGLIIFGFDDAQKASAREHRDKLAAKLPVIALGKPKGMKLRGVQPLSSSAVGA